MGNFSWLVLAWWLNNEDADHSRAEVYISPKVNILLHISAQMIRNVHICPRELQICQVGKSMLSFQSV